MDRSSRSESSGRGQQEGENGYSSGYHSPRTNSRGRDPGGDASTRKTPDPDLSNLRKRPEKKKQSYPEVGSEASRSVAYGSYTTTPSVHMRTTSFEGGRLYPTAKPSPSKSARHGSPVTSHGNLKPPPPSTPSLIVGNNHSPRSSNRPIVGTRSKKGSLDDVSSTPGIEAFTRLTSETIIPGAYQQMGSPSSKKSPTRPGAVAQMGRPVKKSSTGSAASSSSPGIYHATGNPDHKKTSSNGDSQHHYNHSATANSSIESMPRETDSGSRTSSFVDPTRPPVKRVSSVRFADTNETIPPSPKKQYDDMQAAIEASKQEGNPIVSQDVLQKADELVRNLQEIVNGDSIDGSVLDLLVAEAKSYIEQIGIGIDSALSGSSGDDLEYLININDMLTDAVKKAENVVVDDDDKKPPPDVVPSGFDVIALLENKDVFTLVCTLRTSGANKRLDAALAILRLARIDRESERYSEENNRVCHEILSTGGVHSLVAVFYGKRVVRELRVVVALAVAYLLPRFIDSAPDLQPSMCLKLVDCLRFLSENDRDLSPNGDSVSERIHPDECLEASIHAIENMWNFYLGPKIRDHRALSGLLSSPLSRHESFSMRRNKSRTGAVFDKGHEILVLTELMEAAVSLIVSMARRSSSRAVKVLSQDVCSLDAARPVAVREGILEILVRWLKETSSREAALAMRDLTSIKDKYMAGWIHSEIVSKGAVFEFARLGCQSNLNPQLRLAVTEILASLCAAPHTRAAVVEADCVGFLCTYLYEAAQEATLDKLVYFACSALVQLAAGSITRALAFNDEDADARDDISSNKNDKIIDHIVEHGTIQPLVNVAEHQNMELRFMAIEALRVLSEDTKKIRQTRPSLCRAGAVQVLGRNLKENVNKLPKEMFSDLGLNCKIEGQTLRNIAISLSALGNLLESPAALKRTDAETLPIQGCRSLIRSGGLESLLLLGCVPFLTVDDQMAMLKEREVILVEECWRCLVAVAPFLLHDAVAADGHAYGVHGVLNGLYEVLKQLVSLFDKGSAHDGPETQRQLSDLTEAVLQGLAALASAEPLQIRIFDTFLPLLMRLVGTRDSSGFSSTVREVLSALNLSMDDKVVQIAGSDSSLFVEWFALRRSLLIQSMAHEEIHRYVQNLWEDALKSNLVETPTRVFADEVDDDSLFLDGPFSRHGERQRETLRSQYQLIYGKDSEPLQTKEGVWALDQEPRLLKKQPFPLHSSSAERDWVLRHCESLDDKSASELSEHVMELMGHCFPSGLLRDRNVPLHSLVPGTTFKFRVLMMPERQYFTFSREEKLVKRLFDEDLFVLEDVPWSMCFRNSTFGDEFQRGLVSFLLDYSKINGLSFVCDGQDCDTRSNYTGSVEVSKKDVFVNLVKSLPGSVTSLTFSGILGTDELSGLIEKAFEMEEESLAKPQGSLSFLAIRDTRHVSKDVWWKFFRLIGTHNSIRDEIASTISRKPLASLRALDLSYNCLGDELCAKLLKPVLGDLCCIEDLDLSGNQIRSADMVLTALGRAVDRDKKTSLRTLRLASNELYRGDAWLNIFAKLKHSPFDIRSLDLSANKIRMDDNHPDRDDFIDFLTAYKQLERLNLSENSFSLKTIDETVDSLESCRLAFLSFDKNAPALEQGQLERLKELSFRARIEMVSCLGEKRDLEGGNDPAVVYLAEECEYNMTILQSGPLVYKTQEQEMVPLDKLNLADEKESLWLCFKEAQRAIDLVYDIATRDRLIAAATRGCTCLHYSGHGRQSHLAFEDEIHWQTDWISADELKGLISRDGSSPFQLVFVSACYSGVIGENFVSAGVPHVVCCRQQEYLNDSAAVLFTKHFYYSLTCGLTVKEAFDQGCRAVRNSGLSHLIGETEKFVLLPSDGNHDVKVFESASRVSQWPIRVHGSPDEAQSYRLELQNMIQLDPGPAQPENFLGREVEMSRVIHSLMRNRLVSVLGIPGVGRSSLASAVCHYINERRSTVATRIERIFFVKAAKITQKTKNRFLSMMRQLQKRVLPPGKEAPPEKDYETITESVCSYLRGVKALIVFDHVELLRRDEEEWTAFPMMIKELLNEAKGVRILMTNTKELGVPSLQENSVEIQPLNLRNTIKLFAKVCPGLHTYSDRRRLMETLLPGESESTADANGDLFFSDNLREPYKTIFLFMGEGIPTKIENRAHFIDKDSELKSLMDGSILRMHP